jgi:predicted Zn-dependent protease with MMP-like domain
MSDAGFEAAIKDALDSVPSHLAADIANLAVTVEDEPPPGEEDMFGLYEGVPLTERHFGENPPDKITIFRGPLERSFGGDPARLQEEIRRTVLHELAHYFGITDERLDELDRY